MKYEKSCGAIVYYLDEKRVPEYLLIRHVNGGHWAFAKGHVEEGETEIQTAEREIDEETGLTVEIDTSFREVTTYSPKEGVTKDVIYFIAETKDKTVTRQEIEVTDTIWLPYEEALKYLTFENDERLLKAAHTFLNKEFCKLIIYPIKNTTLSY